MQTAVAETTEFFRVDASLRLDPKRKAFLGQYMTPAPIGHFMASLFSDTSNDIRLLDAGAGVGSLTAAFVEMLCRKANKPGSVSLVCYEVESMLLDYLSGTLIEAEAQCEGKEITACSEIRTDDFILSHPNDYQADIFRDQKATKDEFTHVIMNPPYKKINAISEHRSALRKAGIETSNLYTGFMFLAAERLQNGGEMVAIVPRSFCNGPYFKPFREKFFSMMGLRHIHIFEKRNHAFKDDEVLQENIIIHAVKGAKSTNVRITTSRDGNFHFDPTSQEYTTEDMTQRIANYATVINPNNPDMFVHIAVNNLEQGIADRMAGFTTSLTELGLELSTGPVVDFRVKQDLRAKPSKHTAPLLYPAHFKDGRLEWPKTMKKPNAIEVNDNTRKWLWESKDHFVVTKRFTAKEEAQRIVASVCSSSLLGDLVGFENHLNVYHINQRGFSKSLAVGLSVYLNSSLVNRFVQQFSGHTQINATDLRSLKYPDRQTLERIGKLSRGATLSQQEADNLIERELVHMTDDKNPLMAQRKIDEALEIIRALGMPRGQQNERSALTLLAILDLKPSGSWDNLKKPLMGITPIMDYCREHYGREYAPNTRETFRRQTMHQFVEAGIALYNPDQPLRPINSPDACYQISPEAHEVIRTFGTDSWQAMLPKYLKEKGALAEKWAKHRKVQMIPVQIAKDQEITLTPGEHSNLIKQALMEFAPRFAPNSEVIYVGDTGSKGLYLQKNRLASLGVEIDPHGKMPDVVLYFVEKDWLLLIEAVTSHGPVDAKRHNELGVLFAGSKAGLIYVTAFPDRSIMRRYLSEISWETEVWCADAPDHLIHFNGERFLGPYEKG